MKTQVLIYLLSKHKNKSVKKFPETARFISGAYNNVINKISECGSTVDIKKINNLDITDHMKNKLKYLLSQEVSKSDTKKIKQLKLYNDLTKTMGIGNAIANKLIKKGLTDVKQLTSLKWQKYLNPDTILLLKYKPLRLIPYSMIKKIEPKLTKFNGAKIVGGYLRKKPFSKDIDIMVVSDNNTIDDYISYLSNTFSQVHVYSKGKDKASLVIKFGTNYYKIDVFMTLKKYQHGMLLYLTGSKQHNIKMRSIARRKKYLLNQKGIYKNKKIINIKSEKDIFNILDIKYVTPENR